MSELDELKSDDQQDDIHQLVGFRLDDEDFGIDIHQIQEINRMTDITRVPNSPKYVKGVMNLRGKTVPVMDLRIRLDLAQKEYDDDTRIIVVTINKEIIGFIVDYVTEVIRIPYNKAEAPPDFIKSIDTEFIKAVGKINNNLIILLSLEKILIDNQISVV
jgi:purine-binding chemotaxis protein CheW